jgi:hypothetical protein
LPKFYYRENGYNKNVLAGTVICIGLPREHRSENNRALEGFKGNANDINAFSVFASENLLPLTILTSEKYQRGSSYSFSYFDTQLLVENR